MEFDPIDIDSTIRIQAPFQGPKRLVHSFMVGKEETAPAKGMITLNWLLPETVGPKTNFSLRILEYILLGMPASPLRKALIDSGLGEDIAGEGLGTELRQMYFSTGLKGIDTGNAEQIEALIMKTLTTLAQKGIDPHTVEAALNTIEFRLRENNSGHFPRGLHFMLRSLTTWLYDGDPLALLVFKAPLEEIKSDFRANSSFFQEMINNFFVNNPHRTALILEPDPGLSEKEEADEKNRLTKVRSGMNSGQLDEVIKNTGELKRLQETPDSPDALASIPVLKLTDLDRKNKPIPLVRLDRQGTPILFHDLFTNGIAYLDVGFNIHTLPDKYLPYIPLFGRAFVEMGTKRENFVTLTQRISRKTGGIRSQSFTSTVKNAKESTAWLFLRGKAMIRQTEALIDILRDVLLTVHLDNQERFLQMVLEEKARVEQMLVPGGHQVVNLRLRSHFGEAHWAAEQMGGVSYLLFLRDLVGAVKQNWPVILANIEEMLSVLVNRKSMIFNVTLDQKNWPGFEHQIDQLLSELPEGPGHETRWVTNASPLYEGMTIPSQVNYVGKGANLYDLGYRFHGSALVITRYTRSTWLWDQIRVQGGAYGAFCLFDRLSGILTFVSYRDPNLFKTLAVFDQTSAFLRDMELDDRELTKSIIGAIGDMDTHMLPDIKGYTSLLRFLSGETEEARQQMREQVLATKKSDFKAFATVLEEVSTNGVVKVLGSPGAIEAAISERPGWLNVLKVL